MHALLYGSKFAFLIERFSERSIALTTFSAADLLAIGTSISSYKNSLLTDVLK